MKYKVTLEEKTYEIEVEHSAAMVVDEYDAFASIMTTPVVTQAAIVSAPALSSAPAAIAAGNPVPAPLPGNVLTVKVNIGESVKAGQLLAIIEAMKMENEILAPCDGVVKQIIASKGAMVATGDTLLVI